MERKKRKTDERIEKETNQSVGKLFYLVCGLLVVSLIVKCCFRLPVYVYALEIVSLVAGVGYFLWREKKFGILFIMNRDEILWELHNETLTKAMMVQFWIMTIGECIPMYLMAYIKPVQQYFWWYCSYMLVLLPVALIITVLSLKKGWLVWGGKEQEKTGKKNFAIRVMFGALLYGVLMEAFDGFKHVYYDGAFHAEGFGRIFGMAALWGVLFYFAMLGVIKISEKQADKRLKEAGVETDEQGGMANEE